MSLFLEEQREHVLYCTVQWFDTRKIEVIPKESVQVAPSRDVEINVTYTIIIDGKERFGTILAIGTKEQCEMVKYKHSPGKFLRISHWLSFISFVQISQLKNRMKISLMI